MNQYSYWSSDNNVTSFVHCSYNDIRDNRMVRVAAFNDMSFDVEMFFMNDTDQIIEEDFPENRADSDFFSFYFFAVAFPVAALLTIAHLILHGLPIVGFIISLVVSSSVRNSWEESMLGGWSRSM